MEADEKHRRELEKHHQCAADPKQMRPFSAAVQRVWELRDTRHDDLPCDGKQRKALSRSKKYFLSGGYSYENGGDGMANYRMLQLQQFYDKKLDSEKERRQILNYLAMLDEKLRYMFQNIEPSENFSGEAFQNYIKTEKGITSLQVQQGKISALIADMEGNFTLVEADIEGLRSTVANQSGDISLIQQRADALAARVSNAEGDIMTLDATADSILTRVSNAEGNVSTLQQTASSLTTRIANAEGDISSVEQTAGKIEWIIASGTSATNFTLTSRMAKLVAENVDITGFVTFNDLSGSGTTSINGDNIDTGEVSADHIHLGDMMAVHKTGYSSIIGGYIGYGSGDDGDNASTQGIMMTDKNEYNYFIVTTSGVRMTYDDMNAVYCIDGGVYMVADSYGTVLDDTNGNFCPTVDDDQLLGKSTRLWQGLYAGNATIQTSDRRKKNSIEYDMEKYEDFFRRLKPTQYKLNNGESGRYHVGFISQDVEEAMAEAGLDSLDFAGFIKTPVHEKELPNGDYDESTPIIDHKYALRYGEFVALNTHMIQKMMKRIEELEAKVAELESKLQ